MNLTYAYIFLVLAIIFELLSTSFLKDTNGFTNFYPSLIVITALCVCLYLMSHSMKFIPVGIVYASWAGLGIVGITIIAINARMPTALRLFLRLTFVCLATLSSRSSRLSSLALLPIDGQIHFLPYITYETANIFFHNHTE